MAVAHREDDQVSILRGNGDGTFDSRMNYDTGDGPHWLCCADFDGDGDVDIGVANVHSDNVSILLNSTVCPLVRNQGSGLSGLGNK